MVDTQTRGRVGPSVGANARSERGAIDVAFMFALTAGMVSATVLMMGMVSRAASGLSEVAERRDSRSLREVLGNGALEPLANPPFVGVPSLPPRSDHAGGGSERRVPGALCALLGAMGDDGDLEDERLREWKATCGDD